MPDVKSLLQDLNSSLGFHIPGSKAEYLETIIQQGLDAVVEAILSLEGLDRDDDVRQELQAKVAKCMLAELYRKTDVDKHRKTLTLPRSKGSGR